MIRKILFFTLVCFLPVLLLAVPDSVTVNGLSSGAVIARGDTLSWKIYVNKAGDTVVCELWCDINGNGVAEQGTDLFLTSFAQTDGGKVGDEGLPDFDGELNRVIYSVVAIGFAPADYIFVVRSGAAAVQSTFRFIEFGDAPTYTISGRVVYDADNSPAQNVYISAEKDMDQGPLDVFHWGALTGSDGSYTIRTKAAQGSEWYVRARSAESYMAVPAETTVVLSNNITNLDFRLVQAKFIAGIVKDTNDQPLENVQVRVRNTVGMGSDIEGITNSEGKYCVPVSEGKYFVIFQLPDFIRTTYNQKYVEWLGDTVKVSASDDTVKNINAVLRKGGVITGTIRNGTCDGVNLFTQNNWGQPPFAYMYPGSAQAYSMMVLPGTYYVMFSANQGSTQIWYNQKLSPQQAEPVVVGNYPDTVRGIDVDFNITSVVEKKAVVREFKLSQNYPNPFNPSTILEFSVPQDGIAKLVVMNILGQEVANLYDGYAKAGVNYQVKFDGSNLTSGIYFARLEFGGRYLTKKVTLMK